MLWARVRRRAPSWGVVSVYAGKDYHQTASEVLAKEKADISAQHITIDNAINHQANSQSESDLKIGQFTRVKSPPLMAQASTLVP